MTHKPHLFIELPSENSGELFAGRACTLPPGSHGTSLTPLKTVVQTVPIFAKPALKPCREPRRKPENHTENDPKNRRTVE